MRVLVEKKRLDCANPLTGNDCPFTRAKYFHDYNLKLKQKDFKVIIAFLKIEMIKKNLSASSGDTSKSKTFETSVSVCTECYKTLYRTPPEGGGGLEGFLLSVPQLETRSRFWKNKPVNFMVFKGKRPQILWLGGKLMRKNLKKSFELRYLAYARMKNNWAD